MIKRALTLLVALLTGAAFATTDFDAVKAIVGRLASGYAGDGGADVTDAGTAAMAKFTFERIDGSGETATVGPNAAGDGILIKATTASAASYALGQYIRDTQKGHISWCGNRIPSVWPIPTSEKTYAPSAKLRMAYNYCTLSYTMAFWNQRQWREELDRLALNGFNGALMMHGLGKVWKETLTDMGYTTDEIQAFIPDAATWAWWNMGNIEGIGGPVSDAQLDQDAEMAKWMYGAMKELGIEPLLQAFVGLVPSTSQRAMAAKYPENDNGSHYTLLGQGDYQGLMRPWVLHGANVSSSATGDDYSLPAFDDFAAAWYKHLAEVYDFETAGSPLYLGGDLFHEGGSTYGVDVTRYAKKIQSVQQQYYPGVKWILQHWGSNPTQAFVNNLNVNQTIIERLQAYMNGNGADNSWWTNSSNEKFPWIWCEVMNFGGNTGMYGGVTRFRNVTKIGVGDSTFLGWGLLSEGLETNPMVYDILMEQMHQSSNDAMDDTEFANFMDDYLVRRYGQKDAAIRAAVQTLSETVLNTKRGQQGVLESVLCANPKKCPVTQVSSWGPSGAIEYDRKLLYSAAEAYLEAARSASYKDLETFKYDFAELFLQLISDRAREINGLTLTSKSARNEFRKLIDLAEQLLASSDRWRLDWHEGRTAGSADEAAAVRGYRRMVTTWVEHENRGRGSLPEYAHRAYAGLIKDYYGKRWNLFFNKVEGTITEAEYTAAVNALDSSFPTAQLTATEACDLVQIGEEILETLMPPALTWNGETDNTWEGLNWTDGKGNKVEWENGKSVILLGDGKTITAGSAVTIGNVALDGEVKADDQGWIDPTTAIVIAANMSIEEAHTWDYTGVMSGGWFGSPVQRKCAATAYHKSEIVDGAFTVQFQALDTSDGATWLKAVNAKIYQDGSDIKIVSTGTAVVNGGALGSGPISGGSAPATSDGYCIKEIVTRRIAKKTVAGTLMVEGEVVLGEGESLSLPGATLIDTISLTGGTATLGLGETQDLTINVALIGSGAKLVLKGSAATLQGASGSTKVKLPKSALSKIVYVGPEGEEQALKLDAEGYAKTKIGTLSYEGDIGKGKVNLGWKNVTLDDLYNMVYTNREGIQSTQIQKSEIAVEFVIASINSKVTLTIENGSVWAVTDKGVQDLTAAPAVARIELPEIDAGEGAEGETFRYDGGFPKNEGIILNWAIERSILKNYTFTLGGVAGKVVYDDWTFGVNFNNNSPYLTFRVTGSKVTILSNQDIPSGTALVATPPNAGATRAQGVVNYTSLTDAITAANGEAKVTLLDDATTGKINNNFKTWIEIPHGLTLTATCGDFIEWDKAYTLDIYGTLDLGANALSVGTTKDHTLNLYAGGEIKTTNAKGLAIFDANTTINVKANAGFETAMLNTPVQARQNTTIAVDDGVTAVLNGSIVLKAGGESGVANPVVTKTGAGTLEFNGVITTGATLVLSEGTLKRKIAPKGTFTMTVNGGTANVVSTDEDYEIIDTASDNVHTYTSVAIPWVFYVTPAGATTDAAAGGVKFRTLDEALAQRKAWGATAKIWVLRGVSTTLPDGYTINDGSAGSEVIVPEVHLYFPKGVSEWKIDTKVATSKEGEATESVKAGDVITFDNGDFGPIYIHGKTTEKVPAAGFEVLSGTVKIGYEGGNASIPEGWEITVADGATLKFDNWAAGWPVKVMDATFNGEGTICFGDTITAASQVTFGTIKGDATITVKSGITVNAVSIANPVVLEGGATLKSVDYVNVSAAKNYLVSLTEDSDGYLVYTTKHCIFWTAEEWSSKANPAFKDADGNDATYAAGDTVVVKTTSSGVMWVGENGVGVPFIIDGYSAQIENVDKGRASFKDNDVYLVNGASISTRSRWNGVKLENTTIHLEAGTAFRQYTSWAVTVEICGTVTFVGEGSVSFGSEGIKFTNTDSKLVVPEATAEIKVSEIPAGYKLAKTTTDGMTTYALESYDTTRLIWSAGTLWKSSYSSGESPAVFKDLADNTVEYTDGKIVVFKTAMTPWLADAAAGKPFEIDGCAITLMNEGGSKTSFDNNTVTIKNNGSVEFQGRWNGTPVIKSSTITVEAGSKLKLSGSYAPEEIIIDGNVVINGAADDITITKFELKADATLKLPADAKYGVVTSVDGKKVQSESADGVTTYALVDNEPARPEAIPEEHKAAYDRWAAEHGVTGETTPELAEAYAMGCAPADLSACKKAFKVTITMTDEGPVVTVPEGYNIKPVIKGSTDLKTWHDKAEGDKFFKAVIELPGSESAGTPR